MDQKNGAIVDREITYVAIPQLYVAPMLRALANEKRAQLKALVAKFTEALQHFILLYSFREKQVDIVDLDEEDSKNSNFKERKAHANAASVVYGEVTSGMLNLFIKNDFLLLHLNTGANFFATIDGSALAVSDWRDQSDIGYSSAEFLVVEELLSLIGEACYATPRKSLSF